MLFLQPLALAALSAVPVAAFWRLPCAAPVVVERADPIINPGAVSGHLHTIMGGNAFDFSMDYPKTQTSDCTSCQVHGDLSNYWIPTLYYKHPNGTFEQVQQNGGMLVYYLQRKGKDSEKLQAFPEGFRMVAGDPSKRAGGTDFASQAISYNCLDYSGNTHHEETGGFPNYNCPSGLRSQVFFPSCWDGKNLDSADHKSHMAYPTTAYNNGGCPDTHPVHLVSLFYEIIWETDKFKDMWHGDSQPFVWSMGDPTGYGLHGDFLNGWDVDLLQRAVDGCTNDSGRVEDCHEFNLYTAQEAGQCKKTSKVNEALNYIEALPGCNPISNGPEPAQKVASCPNTPDVGSGEDNAASSSYSSGTPSQTSGTANQPSSTVKPVPTTTTLITSTRTTTTYTHSKHTSHSTKASSYGQVVSSSAPGGFYPSSSVDDTTASATPSPSTYNTPSYSAIESLSTTTQIPKATCKSKVYASKRDTPQHANHMNAHLHHKKSRHAGAAARAVPELRGGRTGPQYN